MIEQTIYELMVMTREQESMPDWALAMKLAEECGEVNTAVLIENGFMRHKTLDEDVLHEVADVINVCIGLLTQHYPDTNTATLLRKLNEALIKKGDK